MSHLFTSSGGILAQQSATAGRVAAFAWAVCVLGAVATASTADDVPPAKPDLAGRQVLSVAVPDEAARAALLALAESHPDVSLADDDLGADAVEVQVRADGRAALDAAGFTYTVEIADLAAWYDEHFGGERDGDFFDQYRTYEEYVVFMNDLAARYPDLATAVDIGPTVEGRRQWAIRITGPGGGEKPGVLFMAGMHGDEIVNPPIIAYTAQALLTGYGVDPRLTDLVDNVEWFLLPIVNPDGYPDNRVNGNGADLYEDFGGPGSWPDPFSEPETANIRDFLLAHANVRGFVDLHYNGQWIEWPWSHTRDRAIDHQTYAMLAERMAASTFHTGGMHLGVRRPFLFHGGACQYTYAERRIWSFNFRVTRAKAVEPESILAIATGMSAGLLRFADWLWDCNRDGVSNIQELDNGAPDCNANRMPDSCESQADCDLNGVADICQGGDFLPDCQETQPGATIIVPTDQPTIQDAIRVAGDAATIIVEDGIYTGYGNKNIEVEGFTGVLRSRNGAEHTIIDMEGFERGFAEGGSPDDAWIEGFTIRNGLSFVPTNPFDGNGGGLLTQARVSNCIIEDNRAKRYGGGAWRGTYIDCVFRNNSARDGGGGAGSDFTRCLIVENHASESGGGMHSGTAVDCTIRGNTAGREGGGAYRASLEDCIVSGNSTDGSGGGLYEGNSDRCMFFNNEAVERGGAAIQGKHSNGLFVGNGARVGGAAFHSRIMNCTIVGNRASESGGGVAGASTRNSIVRGNSPDQVSGEDIAYCNIEGGWPGPGNIRRNPRFVAPDEGDYHLKKRSTCIDAGGTEREFIKTTDLDGAPRVQHCAIDMGAYESPVRRIQNCSCTWGEAIELECDSRRNGRKSDVVIRVTGGIAHAVLTLEFDDRRSSHVPITLDEAGAWSGEVRVRLFDPRQVWVEIVECLVREYASCR